jgi:alkaline phosphatase D
MSNAPDPNRSLFGKISFSVVLALLAAMILMATLLAISELRGIAERSAGAQPQTATAQDRQSTVPPSQQRFADLIDVTPEPPWREIDRTQPLTRIGFGSCHHQNHPAPIWERVIATKPELFVMLGDNVYGDIRNGDPNELAGAYLKLGKHTGFASARAAFPFLAIWDDHDYGVNDGGANYRFQAEAATLFRQFWARPEARQPDGGIYDSETVGPPGKRVQFILLDTRSFKSPFVRKDDTFPHWGKYMPDADADKTILGEAQWGWLREKLSEPADLRIITSGIQVLAEGHGWERWGNLPAERERLMQTIRDSGAGGVILVSGDRHAGAHYQRTVTPNASGQTVIPELTASSLNRSFGPSRDTRVQPLISGPHHVENFGLIEINWPAQRVTFALKGLGDLDDRQSLSFTELGTGIGGPVPVRR